MMINVRDLKPSEWSKRGEEKRKIILEWLCLFHYSNQSVLMQLLGLNHRNNSAYFKRLTNQQLIVSVDLPTLKKPAFMLHRNSLALLGYFPHVAGYSFEPRRISASLSRHHIAVQRTVLNRMHNYDSVTPERLMRERGKKIPDALLIKGEIITALEVELSYKSKSKIFLAFTDHARAFRDKKYQFIEYVFVDATMRDYYFSIFNEERWPVFRLNSAKNKYVEDKEMFSPASLPGFKESMKFVVEDVLHD
jgi:hypothetical protein